MSFTRRNLLCGVAACIGTGALANAPLQTVRPQARVARVEPQPDLSDVRPRARPSTAELVARSGVSGVVGVVLADALTGEVIDAVDPEIALPPASVTKAVTALYALDALGFAHRYRTEIYATAPIVDGVLDGDLILVGGGDSELGTDQLATLALTLSGTGLREVKGRYLVWGGAVANVDEIDAGQLDHLGYNPSVSGLNLNFNRVHFEWKRAGDGYDVTLGAPGVSGRPVVKSTRVQLVDRGAPVFAYRAVGDTDVWSVARSALGRDGARWLPVRNPELYAGDVFATLAKLQGISLPMAEMRTTAPVGDVIATYQGAPLVDVMRDMLKFSTNLTAELAGLTATEKITGQRRGMRTSALSMTGWCRSKADIDPSFVDHSGLGDESRISAADMVRLLTSRGTKARLQPLLKDVAYLDGKGRRTAEYNAEVRAKTGTLNFVTTLAGYLDADSGRQLAFAIFAGDVEAREIGKLSGDEQPNGSISFNTRAKRLQAQLLKHWAVQVGR